MLHPSRPRRGRFHHLRHAPLRVVAFSAAIAAGSAIAQAQTVPPQTAPAPTRPAPTQADTAAAAKAAASAAQEPAIDPYHELETKYLFGFTTGADIGIEGEKSIEFETTAAFQKLHGTYRMIEQEFEFEGVPTENFAYELSAHTLYNSIKGVDGLDNLNRTQFSGLSATLSYMLVARGPGSPFGLTVTMQPEWARIDGTSGKRTRDFSNTIKIIADTELVPNRLYAAANLSYDPEVDKAPGQHGWGRVSTLGASGALAYRVAPKVTVGGEVEYYRTFDGLAFNSFAGHAVYVGPTMHIQFTGKTMLSLAFSTQVYGHAAGESHSLDLTNFERYHANAKLEFEF